MQRSRSRKPPGPPTLLLQCRRVPTLYGVQRCRAGSCEPCVEADKTHIARLSTTPCWVVDSQILGRGRPSERHGMADSLYSRVPSAPSVP